jgi:hypothetical protein
MITALAIKNSIFHQRELGGQHFLIAIVHWKLSVLTFRELKYSTALGRMGNHIGVSCRFVFPDLRCGFGMISVATHGLAFVQLLKTGNVFAQRLALIPHSQIFIASEKFQLA